MGSKEGSTTDIWLGSRLFSIDALISSTFFSILLERMPSIILIKGSYILQFSKGVYSCFRVCYRNNLMAVQLHHLLFNDCFP